MATSIPEVGARLAYEAIQQGKHVVMVNVEADVTVGPLLRRLADRARLTQPVHRGEAITYGMVELADPFVLKLRRLQDATV